jgi:hypothetical protein
VADPRGILAQGSPRRIDRIEPLAISEIDILADNVKLVGFHDFFWACS